MMQIDPVALGDWALEREKRLYDHLLLHPFFPATISAVDLTRIPYQVQIQRRLETSQDGAWYACPAFTPRVGDEVVLTWQEDSVAVVAFLLSRNAASGLLTQPIVLTAPAASIVFNGIPQNYQHLKIEITAQTSDAAAHTINCRLNADSGGNYYGGLGGWSGAYDTPAQNGGFTYGVVGAVPPSASTNWGVNEITFFDYAQASRRIAATFFSHRADSGLVFATSAGGFTWAASPLAVISSIQIICGVGNFTTGSKFTLYGI